MYGHNFVDDQECMIIWFKFSGNMYTCQAKIVNLFIYTMLDESCNTGKIFSKCTL